MDPAIKKPGDNSAEASESLSATGMFLNAFSLGTSDGEQADKTLPPLAAKPVAGVGQASQAAAASGQDERAMRGTTSSQPAPGEFTQLFQSIAPSSSAPAFVSVAPMHPLPGPAPAAGEFTQVFVGSQAPMQPPTKTISDMEVAAPLPPRKGFSTPGASDSASSGGGQFTQIFARGLPVAQASPAEFEALPPNQSEARFDLGTNGQRTERSQKSGLTDILRSIEDPRSAVEPTPIREDRSFGALKPMAAPAPQPQPTGSVTQLIQMLTESEQQPLPVPVPAAQSAAFTPLQRQGAPVDAGPGEMTRILSGVAAREVPLTAPAHPAVQPPPQAAAAHVPLAGIALPQIPPPLAEPPKAAPPSAPPTFSAPRSKLQELVPILLVVNTFLLVILLVAVIFALKAR